MQRNKNSQQTVGTKRKATENLVTGEEVTGVTLRLERGTVTRTERQVSDGSVVLTIGNPEMKNVFTSSADQGEERAVSMDVLVGSDGALVIHCSPNQRFQVLGLTAEEKQTLARAMQDPQSVHQVVAGMPPEERVKYLESFSKSDLRDALRRAGVEEDAATPAGSRSKDTK